MASRWTLELLEEMPQVEGERYELIAGELYVTTQPHHRHQQVVANLAYHLGAWARGVGGGRVLVAPGIVFAPDEAVAPDVVWIGEGRLAELLGPDGKVHGPPDLVVEVASPGAANRERDRVTKRHLYGRRGVGEYWIVDWEAETVEVVRVTADGSEQRTLAGGEELNSPLLPRLSLPVAVLFE
jgi:Uma2 family endonuclease